MTHEEWLQHGINNQWVTPTCLMHNFTNLFNDNEQQRFDNGEDPCIPRHVINPPTQ